MDSAEVKAPRSRIPRWVMHVGGYALALACLIWVFKGQPVAKTWEHLRALDWKYVTFAVLTNLSAFVCQAWRWNTLLKPVQPVSIVESSQAIFIGQFASGILPLRPGEIIRCYLLSHWNELPLSLVLTSAAVERIMDGIWLLGAFLLTVTLVRVPHYMISGVRVMAVVIGCLTAVLLFVLFYKTSAHLFLSGRGWGRRFLYVIEEIHRMGNWRTIARAFGISLLYLILEIVPIWAILRADRMDLGLWSATAVLTIQRLGTMVPNAPGNVGPFQASIVYALGLLIVERDNAFVISNIMWLALAAPPLIVGALTVAFSGLNLGEIHHHAHHAHESVHTSRQRADGTD